ncbi:Extracellular membrane protein, CFEM domain, fungi [Penicillium italicum]|uniref:Extracellular membrane protein, CFEM domain, fungi n=1 Tax=Penicillium italicum TaxID=40296 RepID=A0A0A2L9K5_PENIT|nr:Extracellular membrane protein, CFEM domain, fungi [Penicillium italicum]
MKFTITFALAALLTTAAAQGLGDLPDCSKSCATGSIPQSCGIDFKCVCESKSFLADVACCIADKCSKADQDTTIKVARSICARGGVTDLPAEVACSSSKSSSSGASTITGSNSTETGTKSSTETSGATTVTGTKASTTTSNSASNSASSASAAATSTGVAAFTHKDSSLVAAAGAAAAFAILI